MREKVLFYNLVHPGVGAELKFISKFTHLSQLSLQSLHFLLAKYLHPPFHTDIDMFVMYIAAQKTTLMLVDSAKSLIVSMQTVSKSHCSVEDGTYGSLTMEKVCLRTLKHRLRKDRNMEKISISCMSVMGNITRQSIPTSTLYCLINYH